MSTDGIEAVFLTTHNWGRAARFYQALGYELDFETDHNSGQLRNKTGPYLFIAEIPESEPTATQLVFRVPDADAFVADPVLDVVTQFEETHFGTRAMTVQDPDGRVLSLQAPVGE